MFVIFVDVIYKGFIIFGLIFGGKFRVGMDGGLFVNYFVLIFIKFV